MDWRKPNHNVTFSRENAQMKLAQGCDASTRGMHKTMLPGQAWWLEAEDSHVANKFNNLVTAHIDFLNPTFTLFCGHVVNDDDITVVTSNRSPRDKANSVRHVPPINIAGTARMLFGNASCEQLNALTIASTHAIADTGATSIFIMDGVDVVNKRVATHSSFPIKSCKKLHCKDLQQLECMLLVWLRRQGRPQFLNFLWRTNPVSADLNFICRSSLVLKFTCLLFKCSSIFSRYKEKRFSDNFNRSVQKYLWSTKIPSL